MTPRIHSRQMLAPTAGPFGRCSLAVTQRAERHRRRPGDDMSSEPTPATPTCASSSSASDHAAGTHGHDQRQRSAPVLACTGGTNRRTTLP